MHWCVKYPTLGVEVPEAKAESGCFGDVNPRDIYPPIVMVFLELVSSCSDSAKA